MAGNPLFGAWVKDRRRACGLTQKALADKSGCAEITIQKIEKGAARPSAQLAELLAGALELPTADRPTFVRWARDSGSPMPTHPVAAARPNLLPEIPNSFVGRAGEIGRAIAALRRPDVRLLTITGPPGIGKTRLSLQVAARFRTEWQDRLWFIPLMAIDDPALVAVRAAYSLQVAEVPGQDLLTSVVRQLGDQPALLIFDNFEHLLAAGEWISQLLAVAPAVKVLVTSQTVLHLYGEHELVIPPLPLPDPQVPLEVETLLQNEAITLFVQRAQARRSNFVLTPANMGDVATICRYLEGIPLALEIAAAQLKHSTPATLLPKLTKRLDLPNSAWDVATRHHTLRRAVAWAYDLLEPGAQQLFRRLGVFAGGCTLVAAEAVCNAPDLPDPLPFAVEDGLQILIDRSLLQQDLAAATWRVTLLATIREYAVEQLAVHGEVAVYRTHAEWYLRQAEHLVDLLHGSQPQIALASLEHEYANFQAALTWAGQMGIPVVALRLVGTLWPFWVTRGYWSEGRHWLTYALAQSPNAPAELRAAALLGAGVLARAQGDLILGVSLLESSLGLYRGLGDPHGIAQVLDHLAWVAQDQGAYDQMTRFASESVLLMRRLGDTRGIASPLNHLGLQALSRGDYDQAATFYGESFALAQSVDDLQAMGRALNNLGEVERARGNYSQAAALYTERLTVAQTLGSDHGIGTALHNLGYVALAQNRYDQAADLFTESLQLFRRVGDPTASAECLVGLAGAVLGQGAAAHAAQLLGAATALLTQLGTPLQPPDQLEYQRIQSLIQAVLPKDSWQHAFARGQLQPLDQVISDLLK